MFLSLSGLFLAAGSALFIFGIFVYQSVGLVISGVLTFLTAFSLFMLNKAKRNRNKWMYSFLFIASAMYAVLPHVSLNFQVGLAYLSIFPVAVGLVLFYIFLSDLSGY
jgi:hypothetical protein